MTRLWGLRRRSRQVTSCSSGKDRPLFAALGEVRFPKAKSPTIRSGFQVGGGSGLTRAIPGARPAAVQAGYPARLSNQGSNRAVCHRIKQKTDPEVGFSNLAVREGFEPSIRCRIHTFQACSFSHSDTSPNFGLTLNVFSQHGFVALLRRNGA